MLYTGKGDKGTTGLFGCDQRISKSSAIAEALGSLDECNSYIGLAKVALEKNGAKLPDGSSYAAYLHRLQEDLFVIQAELAGTPMSTKEERVRDVERVINEIEKTLPPIRTFAIPGGTDASATLDVARTLARRAERRVTAVAEDGSREVGEWTKAYLNRLSSILYAFARYANHIAGIKDAKPAYK